jgi:CheY-like chemotaxis protein
MVAKERMKLGEILIEQKVLTPLIVQRVIRIAKATHRRFGQTLEDLRLLTGEEIAQALAVQYGYKILSDLPRIIVSSEVLRLVPMEEAFDNRVFPLQVKEGKLAMAMADPTNTDYIGTLSRRLGLKIIPFISTTQDIMNAIAKSYLAKDAVSHMNNSVLVVETVKRVRDTITSPLAQEGYNIIEAVDATDGFQTGLLHLPNVIITANGMSEGDGFTLFTALQNVAETRRIPVILLAERPSPEEEATAFKRGFFDYIPLPVRDITLVSRVGRAMAAGRAYVPYRPGSSLFDAV